MKKRLLALLLSTGLIATTSAGVLAADFSTVPEMTGDTENAAVFQSPPAGEDPDIEAFMEDSSAESNTAENLPDNSRGRAGYLAESETGIGRIRRHFRGRQ